jgi:hypothetical protein
MAPSPSWYCAPCDAFTETDVEVEDWPMISDKTKAAILDKCCKKVDCLARGEVIDLEGAPDLPQSTGSDIESAAWRYEIQHGPDGETDYAWVYSSSNLVCTTKTHYAIAMVAAMRGLAPTPAQEETELELLAKRLAGAELNYRDSYQSNGDSHIETGRKWDKMRKAGDAIRQYFFEREESSSDTSIAAPTQSTQESGDPEIKELRRLADDLDAEGWHSDAVFVRSAANTIERHAQTPAVDQIELRNHVIDVCANVCKAMREKHGSPTGAANTNGDWDQGVRIEQAIRALATALSDTSTDCPYNGPFGCRCEPGECKYSLAVRAAPGQQDRNETLRGLAAFFSESVHHVWDKDEIADCLTGMISEVALSDTSTLGNSK